MIRLPPELKCYPHRQDLRADTDCDPPDSVLICGSGCRVPIVGKIPRFVDSSNYASGFGLQWNRFRETQLDSHSGTTISKDRLTRCLGGSLEVVKGKSVLEVGCGAGRFTEVLLEAEAHVFACDLSQAVGANYENCHRWTNYFICQADVRRLPCLPHSFDFVVCLGVIQHTPVPEETIAALATYVAPDGMLVIDHYPPDYGQNFWQRNLRSLLLRLPPRTATSLALGLARTLSRFHRLSWSSRRGAWRLRKFLLKYSPLVDYKEAYPQLDEELLWEWSVLDTHDTLTDHYKHLRSVEEIAACLKDLGLSEVEVARGGNGVEARARMPSSLIAERSARA